MSRNINVVCAERGNFSVPVGKINIYPVGKYRRIVVCYGERQNHLVNFAVAISAHADYLFFHGGKQLDNLFRIISVGKRIARSVI